jgi:CDGSH-type Zn-finger protein
LRSSAASTRAIACSIDRMCLCRMCRGSGFIPIGPHPQNSWSSLTIAPREPFGARLRMERRWNPHPVSTPLESGRTGHLPCGRPSSCRVVAEGFRLTLCRCGASTHKPLCDGSHTTVNFVASGEVAAVESKPLVQRDGPLTIEPTPDGPLHVTGNLEVVTGTGKTVNRVTDTWLCRCGQSKKKPYCDGSHREAGFRSEQ